MGRDRHTHKQVSDDRFSRLMFGDRERMSDRNQEVSTDDKSSIDFESLLDNIGKLRDSSQNLKPLIQMVYPFVQQFLKKK
jgi:hypothetical protein